MSEGPGRAGLDAVAAALGGRAEADHPLGALTTYRVGGPAALWFEAGSVDDLLAVRRALAGTAVPVLVVGKGSNLLVADAGFFGLAVHLGPGLSGIEIGAADGPAGEPVEVSAGGGAGLPVLARRTVEAGLRGLEWAVGVPGSVGGAVRMNAGGHGADTASRLLRYRWVDLCAEAGGEDTPGRLAFGYRTSSVAPCQVVVGADLRGAPGGRRRGPGGAERDRPLAAPAPARGLQRRVGLHQPPRRLGRPAGGGGRAEGVRAWARPGFRRSTPTSSRPTTGGRPTT